MSLNILRHKSWNVWNKDNEAKVRHDKQVEEERVAQEFSKAQA